MCYMNGMEWLIGCTSFNVVVVVIIIIIIITLA